MRTRLFLLVLSLLFSKTAFCQETLGPKPLTNQEFAEAVKKDFNALIGNSVSNVNSSLKTTFDKKESTIKGDFSFSPKILNNNNNYRHSFTGSVKFGESSNIFDFGKSDMPLLNASFKYNFIPYKRWFYANVAGTNVWTHKRYLWFSPQLNYENNKYTLYDASLSISEQIYKTTYNKYSGNVSTNFYAFWEHEKYNWRFRPRYFYFQVNYEYKKGNNVDQFDQVTIVDYQTFTNPDGGTREVKKEQIAFEGKYAEATTQNLYSEMLIGLNKNVTIDLFGKQSLVEKNNNYIGGGLYFTVKNAQQEAQVNFGLFIQKNKDKDAFIGFKTSLPINL